MFDAMTTADFEIAPTHITVFGATARRTVDGAWEHNFNGWYRRGHSRHFEPYYFCDLASYIEDCITGADDASIAGEVEMIVISPPVACGLYVESSLTDSDYTDVIVAKACWFDILNARFGDIKTPIPLRVAQNPGYFFCCGVADVSGRLL